jgi:peptide/nickel transport system substrate-binding protein
MDWPSYISVINTGPAEDRPPSPIGWAPAFLDASQQVIQYWSGYHPPAGLATSFTRTRRWTAGPGRGPRVEPRQAQGLCEISKQLRADVLILDYVQRFPIVYSAKVADVGSLPNEKFAAIYARPTN